MILNFLFHIFGGKKGPDMLLVPSLSLPSSKLETREVGLVVQGHGEDDRSPGFNELSCLHS